MFARFGEHVAGGFGIYDGSSSAGVNTGQYGPAHFLRGDNGYFMIAELTGRWGTGDAADARPGRLTLGGWGSTSRLVRFDGRPQHGTGGEYLIAEQTLWRPPTAAGGDDPRAVTVFAQYGHGDRQVSGIVDYAGGGLVWTGPLSAVLTDPARRADNAGVGVAYAALSTVPGLGFAGRSELSAEAFYGLKLTPYLIVKPDVQYIVRPAYAPGRDAVVFTIRGTLAF